MESEFKPITFSEEYAQKYWEGSSNKFSRYFTYWQRGLSWVNEAKYIIGFLGLGIWKSNLVFPVWLIVGGGFVSGIIIILIGRWDLHKFSKAREYVTALSGSIIGFQGFNMQVRVIEQNDQIIELLKEIKNKNA